MDGDGVIKLSDIGAHEIFPPSPTCTFNASFRWRPYSTEYAEDKELICDQSVDVHGFGMTMVEVR